MKVNVKERRLYVYILEHRDNLRTYVGTACEGWALRTNDGTLVETYTSLSKASAVNLAVRRLRSFWLVGGQCSELRIRNKNGTFGKARTYPLAADPRRSRG